MNEFYCERYKCNIIKHNGQAAGICQKREKDETCRKCLGKSTRILWSTSRVDNFTSLPENTEKTFVTHSSAAAYDLVKKLNRHAKMTGFPIHAIHEQKMVTVFRGQEE